MKKSELPTSNTSLSRKRHGSHVVRSSTDEYTANSTDSCDRISAERCLEMGLINRVVPEGEHLEVALEMARKIAVIDTFSISVTKKAINRTYEIMGMSQALEAGSDAGALVDAAVVPEREEFMRLVEQEGLKAAIAWRDARFAGS